MQTQDTEINIRLNLSGLLEIYNNAGGDIVLENVQGTPVNQLGFVETTYRGGTLAWWRLLEQYGTLRNYSTDKTGASQILLLTSSDLDDRRADVRGWLQAHPTNQNLLQWIPDMSTWPRATLPAVTAVIDPHRSFPGTGLSEPAPGQRDLLIDDISVTSEAWGSVHAQVNDIIEWNGQDAQGNTLTDGAYTVEVSAKDVDGNDVSASTSSYVTVDSVVFLNGSVLLMAGGKSFTLDNVNEISA